MYSLFRHIVGKYRAPLLCIGLFDLLTNVLSVAPVVAFMVVIDKVIGSRSFSSLDTISIMVIVLVVVEFLIASARQVLAAKTAATIEGLLRYEVGKLWLNRSAIQDNRTHVDSSLHRIYQGIRSRTHFTSAISTVPADLLFCLFLLAGIAYVSIVLAAASILFLLLAAFVSMITAPTIARANDQRTTANDIFDRSMRKLIDSPGSENEIRKVLSARTLNYVEVFSKADTTEIYHRPLSFLIFRIGQVALLWLGATQTIALELSIGQFVAANLLYLRIYTPLWRLTQIRSRAMTARGRVQRLDDLMNKDASTPRA